MPSVARAIRMKHCFIVDDSPIIRKYARLIFEAIGFRVSDAESHAEAFERLQLESPDLILIDWQMPGSNAHDFISKVRNLPLQTVPYIIFMTSENDSIEINKSFHHGADDYLLKPFNREIVEMKLHDIRIAAA